MAKVGKRLKNAYQDIDRATFYDVAEAVKVIKQRATAKLDETIEISMNLGIDPRHADQMVRGIVVLPNGTGKVVRITNFGAFVELVPGKDGLIRNGDLGEMEEELTEGQELTVMIREIDSQGRVNLSRKALFGDDSPPAPRTDSGPPSDRGGDRGGGAVGPRFLPEHHFPGGEKSLRACTGDRQRWLVRSLRGRRRLRGSRRPGFSFKAEPPRWTRAPSSPPLSTG